MSDFSKINEIKSVDEISPDAEFIIIDNSSKGDGFNKVSFFDFEKEMSESSGQKGEKGDRGSVGDPGQKGETGENGLLGKKGSDGFQGNTGDDGGVGDVGHSGDKGQKGDVGNSGSKGRIGLIGKRGESGLKGLPGEKGHTGFKGMTGLRGNIGDGGSVGQKGEPTKFIKGEKGRKGVKGYGRKGKTGDKGNHGSRGTTGVSGEKGFKGGTVNIITSAQDMSGDDWVSGVEDDVRMDVQTEMTKEHSRIFVKIKRGIYYDRFILNKNAFAEIGMQLYDPLCNSSTPMHQYLYDNVSNVLRPMIVTVEERVKVAGSGGFRKFEFDNFVSVRVFYDATFKRIPFTTWSCDTF